MASASRNSQGVRRRHCREGHLEAERHNVPRVTEQGGETELGPGKGALEVVWSTGGNWGGTAQGNTEKSKVG